MALSVPASPVQEVPQPKSQLRNQLAAAVRSINWTYALFWSISSTQPGCRTPLHSPPALPLPQMIMARSRLEHTSVIHLALELPSHGPRLLTWTDGFYNGEVKTRKIANYAELTADQLVMQRSEQLRELYEALLSGECNRRAARPAASLSPEDLSDTEWYYVICMTYAFRPGQGLPGRSFASNECVWMCNAHLANSKTFPRALLAKSASIQTIVCIPLMGGVLELGTTDAVVEDPDLVNRVRASFREMQFPACCEEPSSSPLANETDKAADIIVFEDLDHIAMEAMLTGGQDQLGEVESLTDPSLEHITKEIDEFYSLCEEMDVQALEDTWIMDGSFEVPSSLQPAQGAAATNNAAAPIDGSRATCFTAWVRPESDANEVVVPVVEEPQKLLKKVVGGGAWAGNNDSSSTTRTAEESGIKSHVMLERKRREKLNEMFLVLKSLVPSIHKVNKASILAETIAYLKELQQRVQNLESSREPMIPRPSETKRVTRRHDDDETTVSKKVCAVGFKRKGSELSSDVENEHPWEISKDGTNNVTVTVSGKEVLMEVQCRWEELMMTRVFDAIKDLQLDVLSVQASAPDGFMWLKIQAQFAASAVVVPWMISEALRKAIGKR